MDVSKNTKLKTKSTGRPFTTDAELETIFDVSSQLLFLDERLFKPPDAEPANIFLKLRHAMFRLSNVVGL